MLYKKYGFYTALLTQWVCLTCDTMGVKNDLQTFCRTVFSLSLKYIAAREKSKCKHKERHFDKLESLRIKTKALTVGEESRRMEVNKNTRRRNGYVYTCACVRMVDSRPVSPWTRWTGDSLPLARRHAFYTHFTDIRYTNRNVNCEWHGSRNTVIYVYVLAFMRFLMFIIKRCLSNDILRAE